MYDVEYTNKAAKALEKLDRATATMIYTWIDKNLEGCADPRRHGKALVGNKKGYWRYRVGSYRLIAEIDDGRIKILIINVAYRRQVY